MWTGKDGKVRSPREAWAAGRDKRPAVEEFEGRCAYCHHIVVDVAWKYRRLPYRLWFWRWKLLAWTARRKERKLDFCPQCEFNAGPRWVGIEQ